MVARIIGLEAVAAQIWQSDPEVGRVRTHLIASCHPSIVCEKSLWTVCWAHRHGEIEGSSPRSGVFGYSGVFGSIEYAVDAVV
jgi:hypothetical protein